MERNTKGQVWIETVTYTLIAFVLIGLVLAFAKPKIDELQDQAVIEQSANMLREIDSIIMETTEQGVGNKRKVEFNLKEGEILIDAPNNSVIFTLEGNYMFSQPGTTYEESGLNILTEEYGKEYHVTLTKKYNEINITNSGKENRRKLVKASTPYSVFITNKGGETNNIDFQVD